MLKEPVDTTTKTMTMIMIMTKIKKNNNNNNLFYRTDTTAWVNDRDSAGKKNRKGNHWS
jgi:hypothetical protein